MTRRRAIVTGAARGLGRSIALELAAIDFDIVGLDRDAEPLAAVLDECRSLGAETEAVAVDLADEADRHAAFSALPVADLVVANAGMLEIVPAIEMTTAQLNSVLTVNTVATFDFVRSAIGAMLAADAPGRVLIIASTSALRAHPSLAGYAASKHAVRALALGLGNELKDTGIRITTAYPAGIATGIGGGPKETWGGMLPEEVAHLLIASVLAAGPSVRLTEIHLTPPSGD